MAQQTRCQPWIPVLDMGMTCLLQAGGIGGAWNDGRGWGEEVMRLPVWGHSLTPFPSTTLRVNFEIRASGYINGFWDRVLWGLG